MKKGFIYLLIAATAILGLAIYMSSTYDGRDEVHKLPAKSVGDWSIRESQYLNWQPYNKMFDLINSVEFVNDEDNTFWTSPSTIYFYYRADSVMKMVQEIREKAYRDTMTLVLRVNDTTLEVTKTWRQKMANIEFYRVTYCWQNEDSTDTGVAFTVLEKRDDEPLPFAEVEEHIKEMNGYSDVTVLTWLQIDEADYRRYRDQLSSDNKE